MNTVTPRLFVAATRQNDGKTTTALGLFAAFKKRLGRIGFIKPVGQRFVEVEGKSIDEDSLLIEDTFNVQVPLEDMSPIAVEPDFTRRYIEHANNDFLVRRLQRSFDRAAWEKEFVIVEGTGHAGVGSVFDLSNARVAKLLGAPVILITGGGIGKPIDEIALNHALFDREGVEIAGVILNKVLPAKQAYIEEFARRGLARMGVDLLGVIPEVSVLADPTLAQIAEATGGKFFHAAGESRRHVRRIIIGAMSSGNVVEHFSPGTLVITPGDREDIILAAISSACVPGGAGDEKNALDADACLPPIAGLVLAGGLRPHASIRDMIARSGVPVITSPLDSYEVARRIHSMTVKTLPGDQEKIDTIQSLVEKHVEVDRLLEKLRAGQTPAEAVAAATGEVPSPAGP